jgi:carbohydrate 3-sulfotransferase 10
VEEIPENLVHDHEKNGLPRLSSLTEKEITKRFKALLQYFRNASYLPSLK